MAKSLLAGSIMASCVGTLFAAAYATGMSRTGFDGPLELLAFLLAVLTAPVSAAAAVAGRLAFPHGLETAFMVTGVTWAILCVPYGAVVTRIWLRTRNPVNPEPLNP